MKDQISEAHAIALYATFKFCQKGFKPLLKVFLKNKEMVLKNGVKNIQAVAYNCAQTVVKLVCQRDLVMKYKLLVNSKGRLANIDIQCMDEIECKHYNLNIHLHSQMP